MKTNVEKDLMMVETIKTGNKIAAEKACAALFNKYHPSVLFHYRKMLSDKDMAEDLAIEAFAKAFEKIKTFDSSTAAFSTWLFSLTRNLFIDSLRKKKEEFTQLSEMTVSDEDGHTAEKELFSTEKTADEEIEIAERNKKLAVIIDKTFEDNPHLKKLIEMRYFKGMSYENISTILDCPIGTVKAHLHRAKKMLLPACKKAGVRG